MCMLKGRLRGLLMRFAEGLAGLLRCLLRGLQAR